MYSVSFLCMYKISQLENMRIYYKLLFEIVHPRMSYFSIDFSPAIDQASLENHLIPQIW